MLTDWMIDNITRLQTGSNYPAVNDSDVFNQVVPLPTLEEQQRIASVLNACDQEIEILEYKLEAFKNQKKGLMQKLLTGKIRVKV